MIELFLVSELILSISSVPTSTYVSNTAVSVEPAGTSISQDTLVRAAQYLREITTPNGYFVQQCGEYYWRDDQGSLKKYHPNAIKSFAEKKEIGKSIRYISPQPPIGVTPKIEVAACYIYVGTRRF